MGLEREQEFRNCYDANIDEGARRLQWSGIFWYALLGLGVLRCLKDRGGRTIGFIERQRRIHDQPLHATKVSGGSFV